MAKINEEIIVIKISTLLHDNADAAPVMDSANVDALIQVIEQMAGDGARTLVEIERA